MSSHSRMNVNQREKQGRPRLPSLHLACRRHFRRQVVWEGGRRRRRSGCLLKLSLLKLWRVWREEEEEGCRREEEREEEEEEEEAEEEERRR